jgi:putative sterol carrier protein
VLAQETIINELKKRFKPQAAKDITAAYLINIKGEKGGAWLLSINNGELNVTEYQEGEAYNCKLSINAEDMAMIIEGRMSAMTAALSGVLSVEGDLGQAMKLVPIFFEG